MNLFPTNLPSYIQNQLISCKTEEDLLNELSSSESLFHTYFHCLGKNVEWLKEHTSLAEKVLEKAYVLIETGEKKENLFPIFQYCIPKFCTILKNGDEVTFASDNSPITVNRYNLEKHSDFFKRMLSESSNFKESMSFKQSLAIQISHEQSDLYKSYLAILDSFTIPSTLNEEDLETILSFAKMYDTPKIIPLIEKALIQKLNFENSYNLCMMAQEHGLFSLRFHCARTLYNEMDEESYLDVLTGMEGTSKEFQDQMIYVCLNYAIGRLPLWKKDIETFKKHLELFDQYLPRLIGIDNENLHKLSDSDFKAIMERLPKDIVRLNFSGIDLKDLSILKKFTELTSLSLSGTKIVNLATVSHLKKLRELDISNCAELKIISALKNCPDLMRLDIDNCSRLFLDPLEKHVNFVKMEILTNNKSLDRFIKERCKLWQVAKK